MHKVLINLLGGRSLPRKSVVKLTDHRDMTLAVYCGRKTTQQQLTQQMSILTAELTHCFDSVTHPSSYYL